MLVFLVHSSNSMMSDASTAVHEGQVSCDTNDSLGYNLLACMLQLGYK